MALFIVTVPLFVTPVFVLSTVTGIPLEKNLLSSEKALNPVLSPVIIKPLFKVSLLFSATYNCAFVATGTFILLSIVISELFAPYSTAEFNPILFTVTFERFDTLAVLSFIYPSTEFIPKSTLKPYILKVSENFEPVCEYSPTAF